eukprot:2801967-Amphidinium_carterae.1
MVTRSLSELTRQQHWHTAVLIDVRRLPDARRHNHVGLHAECLQQLILDLAFDKLFQRGVRAIADAQASGKDAHVVAICSAGSHQSVGMSYLWQVWYQAVYGHLARLEHFCQFLWMRGDRQLCNLPHRQCPGELDIATFYLDDGTLCGTGRAVQLAVSLLEASFADIGLNMNAAKCKIIPCDGGLHPAPSTFARFSQVPDGNFELLGAPIGSAEFCRGNLADKILAAEPLLQAISELPSKQSAMHLLRYCGTYSLVTHLMRTVPFQLLQGGFEDYDAAVRLALELSLIHI